MVNCITTGHEFWTETFSSTGIAATMALASGTLSNGMTNQLKAINNYGVANSYVHGWMVDYVVYALRTILARKTGAAD